MDGIIVIDKPLGITSRQAVSKVSKLVNEKKAGHTGTLDPFATGVLPVLLGRATKISKYLVEHDKRYVAEIFLGEKRDTGDREGIVVENKSIPNLSNDIIKNVLDSFNGKQKQIPPMYSAIKIDGKKLYEYARNGIEVEREPRDIEIYEINLISFEQNIIKFEVACSKGTYIRVLCEDIASKLGTVGYMFSLRRTMVDKFKIEDSVKLDESLLDNNRIISIEEYFIDRPRIDLNERKKELFLNGVKLTFENDDGVYRIFYNNEFLGLGVIENRLLKRDVII